MEYLKEKIDELAKNSKKKSIRDLYRGRRRDKAIPLTGCGGT
jgi:hypothetical protein